MNRIRKFLTLSITETAPQSNSFHVIAMELRSKALFALALTREQIATSAGEVFWDIGFVSQVEGNIIGHRDALGNQDFVIDGRTKLVDNCLGELKEILGAKAKSTHTFFEKEDNRFAVCKVVRLDNIVAKPNAVNRTIKCYISAHIEGIPFHENPQTLLIKDYRWIAYWSNVLSDNSFKEKREKFISLYNRKGADLYLILYRHMFDQGSNHWIVGVHWL